MVDYKRTTGEGGVMMIRDTGTHVEFWIRAAYTETRVGALGWDARVNGTNYSGTVSYPRGRPWVHIATYAVSTSQDVLFHIDKTITKGIGGPTDFWQKISRSTVPPAPRALDLTEISFTSMKFRFSGQGQGGAPFLRWEAAIADNSGFTGATILTSSGTTIFENLDPGTMYWARGRGVNSLGNGAWSGAISARTLSGALIKIGGVRKSAVPYVKSGGVWKPAIPYLKSGIWKPSSG